MEAEAIEILKDIRGMLYVLVFGFGLLFVLVIISTITSLVVNLRDRLKIDFSDKVKKLYETQKYKELIKLCTKEIEIFPKSAEANWWLARAQSKLGNDLEALRLFRKVTEIEPTWEAEYVIPYVKEINERIKNR